MRNNLPVVADGVDVSPVGLEQFLKMVSAIEQFRLEIVKLCRL